MKEVYSFQYKLNYDEAYETFLLLSTKWSRKVRIILTAAVVAIAVGFLIGFFLDSAKAHYFVIALAAILVLAYMVYLPTIKAKRGAARVQKTGGTYKIDLTRDGQIVLAKKDTIPLKGDKQSRAVETDRVFAIRADRLTTVCIPKRVIGKKDMEDVRNIFKTYIQYQDLRENEKEAP